MKYAKREVENSQEFFGFSKKLSKPPVRPITMTSRDAGEANAEPKDIGSVRPAKGRVIPFPVRQARTTDQADRVRGQKLTILIVEDHGSLCDMLSLYLMRYGYHVRTANDGEGALAILDNQAVHLVLLDLMLPRIDGFAVLREIRERQEEKHPYVIVVSAGASTKDRSRVLEMGANEYMPKPFHLMRLLERIQNVEKYLLS